MRLAIRTSSGSAGRQNPPQAAKLDGGVSGPEIVGETPRKRSKDRTPRKKARGSKKSFFHHLNRERVYAAASTKANPPSIAADKYDDPEDRGGAPKAPAKGGHGIKAKTVNENNSDNNEITSIGTKKPAPL